MAIPTTHNRRLNTTNPIIHHHISTLTLEWPTTQPTRQIWPRRLSITMLMPNVVDRAVGMAFGVAPCQDRLQVAMTLDTVREAAVMETMGIAAILDHSTTTYAGHQTRAPLAVPIPTFRLQVTPHPPHPLRKMHHRLKPLFLYKANLSVPDQIVPSFGVLPNRREPTLGLKSVWMKMSRSPASSKASFRYVPRAIESGKRWRNSSGVKRNANNMIAKSWADSICELHKIRTQFMLVHRTNRRRDQIRVLRSPRSSGTPC